jgi:hypothetical protein
MTDTTVGNILASAQKVATSATQPLVPSYERGAAVTAKALPGGGSGGGKDEHEEENNSNNNNHNHDDDMLNLLIEIVSATDFPGAELRKDRPSDPYVKVWLGTQKIHKTSVISNSNDPIWTVETGSLFLISMPLAEFFSGSSVGLTFEVLDYDAVGKHDRLGKVVLS